RDNVAASTCVIKVRNRKKFICMWYHLEQLYNSLMRLIMAKVNANIVTPGPLSVYRKDALEAIGGFSTEGFAEDVDITIRLVRKGYKTSFAEGAVSETNLPHDIKGIIRQRTRFARGIINILKRHLSVNRALIDLYTLPLLLFAYAQAVIMGAITLYQIFSGYAQWYVSQGVYFNGAVLNYFVNWATLIGFFKWMGGIFTGATPLTIISIMGIITGLLSYPLYLYVIAKYDRRFDWRHGFALFFMMPFWWFIMVIYIFMLPEIFRKQQYNIWKKNE
ncbi:MAG: glycosyltransferase family 2 protein, partial [Nanoarchaeota archaeon]